MGRLGHDTVIQHFSHPHPLELSNLQQALVPATCSGCRLRASGWTYACKACNYFLHITCAQMPQYINHPADPNHALALLAVPIYPEGFFNCDACGQQGTGFSYHCGECDLDVHALCASTPLSVTHQAHHHPLGLAFFPPYQTKGFSCDLCGNTGSSHWLYRCAACEFDAHISCATAKPRQAQQPRVQAAAVGLPGARAWQGNTLVVAPQMVNPMGRQTAGNGLVDQAIQGFVQSAAQQMGQSLVQDIFGGGGGGGDGSGNGSGN